MILVMQTKNLSRWYYFCILLLDILGQFCERKFGSTIYCICKIYILHLNIKNIAVEHKG
jgi:hypothetical protein